MEVRVTPRGFQIIEFIDLTGVSECSLQQSSAIADDDERAWNQPGSSAVWLGCRNHRMHLNREMVGELVGHLTAWLDNGRF